MIIKIIKYKFHVEGGNKMLCTRSQFFYGKTEENVRVGVRLTCVDSINIEELYQVKINHHSEESNLMTILIVLVSKSGHLEDQSTKKFCVRKFSLEYVHETLYNLIKPNHKQLELLDLDCNSFLHSFETRDSIKILVDLKHHFQFSDSNKNKF